MGVSNHSFLLDLTSNRVLILKSLLEVINRLGRCAILLEIENIEHFPTFFTQFIDLTGKFRITTKLACIVGQGKMLPLACGPGFFCGGSGGCFVLSLGWQKNESESEGKDGDAGDGQF